MKAIIPAFLTGLVLCQIAAATAADDLEVTKEDTAIVTAGIKGGEARGKALSAYTKAFREAMQKMHSSAAAEAPAADAATEKRTATLAEPPAAAPAPPKSGPEPVTRSAAKAYAKEMEAARAKGPKRRISLPGKLAGLKFGMSPAAIGKRFPIAWTRDKKDEVMLVCKMNKDGSESIKFHVRKTGDYRGLRKIVICMKPPKKEMLAPIKQKMIAKLDRSYKGMATDKAHWTDGSVYAGVKTSSGEVQVYFRKPPPAKSTQKSGKATQKTGKSPKGQGG